MYIETCGPATFGISMYLRSTLIVEGLGVNIVAGRIPQVAGRRMRR